MPKMVQAPTFFSTSDIESNNGTNGDNFMKLAAGSLIIGSVAVGLLTFGVMTSPVILSSLALTTTLAIVLKATTLLATLAGASSFSCLMIFSLTARNPHNQEKKDACITSHDADDNYQLALLGVSLFLGTVAFTVLTFGLMPLAITLAAAPVAPILLFSAYIALLGLSLTIVSLCKKYNLGSYDDSIDDGIFLNNPEDMLCKPNEEGLDQFSSNCPFLLSTPCS